MKKGDKKKNKFKHLVKLIFFLYLFILSIELIKKTSLFLAPDIKIFLLQGLNPIKAISIATQDFKLHNRLKITVTKQYGEIPDINHATRFKYSSRCIDNSSLQGCSERIKDGEDLTVVVVWNDELLIGYGIAVSKNNRETVRFVLRA